MFEIRPKATYLPATRGGNISQKRIAIERAAVDEDLIEAPARSENSCAAGGLRNCIRIKCDEPAEDGYVWADTIPRRPRRPPSAELHS
jgi:hypothetical protein